MGSDGLLSFQTHHYILLELLQWPSLLCTMKSLPQPGSLESLTSGQALCTCLLIMPYFTLCVPPITASQLAARLQQPIHTLYASHDLLLFVTYNLIQYLLLQTFSYSQLAPNTHTDL